MKHIKLCFLIISFLFTFGCNSNYQSLNDLVIVSSILIDKDDNNFITYIELYKSDKDNNTSSYFVKGYGKTISAAIGNASNSISKDLYFVHLNAVIISNIIANNEINTVFDYLKNKVSINSNYFLLVSSDINELIKSKDNDNNILGEKIKNLLNYSYNMGSMVNYDFMEKLSNYTNDNKDIYLSNIDVINDSITIKDGYYFSKDKCVGMLYDDELCIINLFKKEKNIYFVFENYTIKIDNVLIKYIINENININIVLYINIVDSNNININDNTVIDDINKKMSLFINNNINNILKKFKDNKSDVLGINDYIYKIYGYKKRDFFIDKTNVSVLTYTNKNGLTNEDSYEE